MEKMELKVFRRIYNKKVAEVDQMIAPQLAAVDETGFV